MTDPEFATATYIEPLTPASVAKVIERERPDAMLPTLGGGTALDLARELSEDGTLAKYRVELIGADYEAIRRAEDRELFRATMERAGLRVPRSAAVKSMREAEAVLPEIGLPAIVQARVHDGRRRRRHGAHGDRLPPGGHRGPRRQPDRPGPDRGVGDRLGRVRARGDARPRGQRRDRLLDREHRPDGRPHGRQRHRRAAADAHRPPLPGAARPGARGDPRGRRRDGRLEHPVRGQPGDRRDRRDRDEPARLALVGARLQGDRLPDRQDRRPAGRRLRARGDRQRHHAQDARLVRADDRLRGRQVAALRLREVPRRRRRAAHLDAVGGRGDGDRAHLQAGVRQGAALARARRRAELRGRPARPARDTLARPLRADLRGGAARSHRGRDRRADRDRPLVRGRAGGARARRGPRGGTRALVQVGRHLRRRVRGRDALLLLGLGAPGRARGQARRPAQRDDPRVGAEPDRPGHRVRLLLRARRHDRARLRSRRGDGQLQPGDGVDRLRHVRPPLLRAAHAVGRARRGRGRAAGGRDRPVRRPDAAEARGRPGRRGRAAARHAGRLDPPRRGPAQLRAACSTSSASRGRPTRPRSPPRRRSRSRPGSATRCSSGRATCSAAGRWRSATRATRSPTT